MYMCFSLQVTGRVYNLSADSEVDQNEWLLAINQTLSVLAEQKAQTVSELMGPNSLQCTAAELDELPILISFSVF